MKLRNKLILSVATVGALATNTTVCYKIGTSMKATRESQEAKVEKARKTAIKMEQAEMVGRAVERAQAEELAKKQLQEDLQEDYNKHKNDKPVQATSKPLTQEEKENLNKG